MPSSITPAWAPTAWRLNGHTSADGPMNPGSGGGGAPTTYLLVDGASDRLLLDGTTDKLLQG